jgi:hypothetical protein
MLQIDQTKITIHLMLKYEKQPIREYELFPAAKFANQPIKTWFAFPSWGNFVLVFKRVKHFN